MKHTLIVTLLLLGLFLSAQVVGLLITNFYMKNDLPAGIERPQINQEKPIQASFWIFIFILVASFVFFLFARFNIPLIWRACFFIAVVVTLYVSFSIFLSQWFALALALFLAFFKVVKRNIIIHNMTEILIYGALAAILVPVLSLKIMVILLIAVSVYDIISVFVTKHMVVMAKFQARLKSFAGFLIPYKKNIAVLGGGDIGFPLLFAGVLLKEFGFKSLVVSIAATFALAVLLYKAEKKKFYPAMPFIAIGCLIGYSLLLLFNLIV